MENRKAQSHGWFLRTATAAVVLNALVAAAPASAGWDDDVCGPDPHACCPECNINCHCSIKPKDE